MRRPALLASFVGGLAFVAVCAWWLAPGGARGAGAERGPALAQIEAEDVARREADAPLARATRDEHPLPEVLAAPDATLPLSVRVTDALDGSAVAGACVKARSASWTSWRLARTDEAGRVELDHGLPLPEPYVVVAPGYEEVELNTAPREGMDFSVVLPRSTTLDVCVDAGRLPRDGLTVCVAPASEPGARLPLFFGPGRSRFGWPFTAWNGETPLSEDAAPLRFDGCAPGVEYVLTLRDERGALLDLQRATLGAGEWRPVTLTAKRACEVAVHVVDAAGRAASRAQVFVWRDDPSVDAGASLAAESARLVEAATDAEGRAVVRVLAERVGVLALYRGAALELRDVPVVDGDTLLVRLPEPAPLEVLVRERGGGAPVAHAVASLAHVPAGPIEQASTDAAGSATLALGGAGVDWEISVDVGGRSFPVDPAPSAPVVVCEVDALGSLDVDLRLSPVPLLFDEDSGDPATVTEVKLESALPWSSDLPRCQRASVWAAPAGEETSRARFPAVFPGRYRVWGVDRFGVTLAETEVDVAAGAPTRVQLDG